MATKRVISDEARAELAKLNDYKKKTPYRRIIRRRAKVLETNGFLYESILLLKRIGE